MQMHAILSCFSTMWDEKDETRRGKQVCERGHKKEIIFSLWWREEGSWKYPRERKRRRWEGERIREPPKLPKPPNQAAFLELDPSLVHHLRAEKQSCALEEWERQRERNNEQVSAKTAHKGKTAELLKEIKLPFKQKKTLRFLSKARWWEMRKGLSRGEPEISEELCICNNKAMSSLSLHWMN